MLRRIKAETEAEAEAKRFQRGTLGARGRLVQGHVQGELVRDLGLAPGMLIAEAEAELIRKLATNSLVAENVRRNFRSPSIMGANVAPWRKIAPASS